MEWLIVTLASFASGLMDAVAGGGGLILIPALFATFLDASPASLFGTNKSASVWGTSFSAWQYSRRVPLRRRMLLPAFVSTFLGALIGAWTVTQIDPGFLRRLLPFVLLGVFIYTLRRRDLGTESRPLQDETTETLLMCTIAILVGFYDGFFGPGTGSFFVFLFVRFLGHDFLQASAHARVLNVATNLSALGLFAGTGHVWWALGAVMAVANVAGSLVGTRLALRYGSGFVRQAFIVVVGALILKTGWDALRGLLLT